MKKIFLVMLGLGVLVLSGCSTCNKAKWPEQPVLEHMSTGQKSQYLADVKQTLVHFRTTAVDLQNHQPQPVEGQPVSYQRQGFHCEVVRYVDVYVLPILNDAEARQNLETRLEVAKVHLLGAYALYETGGGSAARRLLKMYDRRYRSDAAIEAAMVDSSDMEFATLGEGARNLRSKLVQ